MISMSILFAPTRAIGCGQLVAHQVLLLGEKFVAESCKDIELLLLRLGSGWQHFLQWRCMRIFHGLPLFGDEIGAHAFANLALLPLLVDSGCHVGR